MAKQKKKKQVQPIPLWFKHVWWAVPLLAVLVYLPSFSGDFTLDDIPIIEDNMLIRSVEQLPQIWTSHYWAGKLDASDTGLYRPLTLTTYAVQYWMHGKNAIPYHIFNILLHALTVFVMMRYASLLFNDYRLTVLSGLIFAIHPVHAEAVAGIVGRAEIMAALFILFSGISYHHWRQNGSIKWLVLIGASTMAAILSKEHGFLIPFILVLQEVIFYQSGKKQIVSKTRSWIGLGVSLAIAVIWWLIRNTITGPSKPHEQWLNVDAADRMATSVRIIGEYLWLHVFPLNLSADYWTSEVPIVGWGDVKVLTSFVLILVILALVLWQFRKTKSFSWGILFFFLTLAPVSNFFFPAGFLKAERILYIPSIGLIIALSGILIRWYDLKRLRIMLIVLLSAFTIFFLVRTWLRSADWKNNYTLAEATLRTSPDSPRFNNIMGLELRARNRNTEALTYFEKAVKSNPHHAPALVNLGLEYRNFKRHEEAATILERSLAVDSSTLMAYVNLMAVYREMKDYDKNLHLAKRGLARFPQSAPLLWNAANAYQLKNDMEKANELRAKAREIQPDIMK